MNDSAPPGTTARGDAARVRPAESTDAAAIAQIYNHYVDVGGATFDTEHWQPDYVAKLIRGPKPNGWFVATDHETVIGWASVRRYSARQGYRLTCETAIYVAAQAMGGGIAHPLQTAVEEHCRQCRLHHAVAKIVADNQRSLAFHYRYGYELVGIQKEIGNLNGTWIDVAILQKIY